MKRYGLPLRRKTTISQHDSVNLIDKLISYVLQKQQHSFKAENIIAMDETAVWADMISDTTVHVRGAKTITMKSTGHEKNRVSICLTAKADGIRLKPMIVFKGAKREAVMLNQELKVGVLLLLQRMVG